MPEGSTAVQRQSLCVQQSSGGDGKEAWPPTPRSQMFARVRAAQGEDPAPGGWEPGACCTCYCLASGPGPDLRADSEVGPASRAGVGSG